MNPSYSKHALKNRFGVLRRMFVTPLMPANRQFQPLLPGTNWCMAYHSDAILWSPEPLLIAPGRRGSRGVSGGWWWPRAVKITKNTKIGSWSNLNIFAKMWANHVLVDIKQVWSNIKAVIKHVHNMFQVSARHVQSTCKARTKHRQNMFYIWPNCPLTLF